MTARQKGEISKELSKAVKRSSKQKYVLKLYITGMTPRSTRAVMQIREICKQHLQGGNELEIIDIFQQPVLAKGEQIIAALTLIKNLPHPIRRIIGDMTDTERVLIGLDLKPKQTRNEEK
jgi:circadian clock protein KaiB